MITLLNIHIILYYNTRVSINTLTNYFNNYIIELYNIISLIKFIFVNVKQLKSQFMNISLSVIMTSYNLLINHICVFYSFLLTNIKVLS